MVSDVRWMNVDTPIDVLGIAVDEYGLCAVRFGYAMEASTPVEEDPSEDAQLFDAAEQIREYFEGSRTTFELPLSIRGGTEFERAVWGELALIPYGEMVTYGSIARSVGDVTAARAVGIACNRNPVPIVVPCHRVVGAGGKLVGFGGGLNRKRYLLELEASVHLTHLWS